MSLSVPLSSTVACSLHLLCLVRQSRPLQGRSLKTPLQGALPGLGGPRCWFPPGSPPVPGGCFQFGEGVLPLLLDLLVFATPLCVFNRGIFRQVMLKESKFYEIVRGPNIITQFTSAILLSQVRCVLYRSTPWEKVFTSEPISKIQRLLNLLAYTCLPSLLECLVCECNAPYASELIQRLLNSGRLRPVHYFPRTYLSS